MTQKHILLIVVVLGHIFALYWLDIASRYSPMPHVADRVLLIDFIVREKKPVKDMRIALKIINPVVAVLPVRAKKYNALPSENSSLSSAESTLTLINKDGSIILPQQTREAFLNDTENRQFAVQHKGIDDMEKLLDRPVVLDYQASMFEKDWQGDKPRLSRILEEAVSKSTVRVKIPIPGRPGAYLRCGVAILAMGGSCGFTANDDGYFVRADDPDTLSPEEDRQCQAWWDLIVSAKTQALWRKTKQLYRQECEKPLAK